MTLIQIKTAITGLFTNSKPSRIRAEEVRSLLHDLADFADVNNGAASFFEFSQPTAAATWDIVHNLGKYPSVSIVDNSGNIIEAHIQHIDNNNLKINFSIAFLGKAYLN